MSEIGYQITAHLSGIGTRIDGLREESRNLSYESRTINTKLAYLMLIGIFIALVLTVNVIHHW
jgi:hypothetical protein